MFLKFVSSFRAISCGVSACTNICINSKYQKYIKTLHFEYISESVASGLMSVGLQTSTPVVYGVLNCLNEDQVKARSSGDNNHGYDWGKTAVEMALLRADALNINVKEKKKAALGAMGFGKASELEGEGTKKKSTFF